MPQIPFNGIEHGALLSLVPMAKKSDWWINLKGLKTYTLFFVQALVEKCPNSLGNEGEGGKRIVLQRIFRKVGDCHKNVTVKVPVDRQHLEESSYPWSPGKILDL